VDLSGALPDLSSNVEIEGSGADQLTVKRSTGGDYRIFTVTSGSEVSISGITISGGNVPGGSGGGINNGGTLTISGSTISGNPAAFGGGVFSDTFLSTTEKITITNSTITGNTAANRDGGVRNRAGLSVIEHSTITGNTAPSGAGSGVGSAGDGLTRTEVLPTIVSDNQGTDMDFDGSTNSFVSKGYNLTGDGNATSAFDQTDDQSGVSDPKLGALADNSGPTNTHRLLARSPAIDKGKSDLAPDQRGEVRPFDDPNIGPADGGYDSDIGSFEAQSVLNSAPEAKDDAYSTNEDAALTKDALAGVLANDTDPNSADTLTAVLVSGPTNGRLCGGEGNDRLRGEKRPPAPALPRGNRRETRPTAALPRGSPPTPAPEPASW
jgi:hypothetical protein